MLNIYKNFSKQYKQKGKKGLNKIKTMVMIVTILLLAITSIRAYNIYERYYFMKENVSQLEHSMYKTRQLVLEKIISSGYKEAVYLNKIATDNLQFDLINKHNKKELTDLLNDSKKNPEIQKTLTDASKKYYRSIDNNKDNILIIGTEKQILYVDSNIYKEKFKNLNGDNIFVSWNKFFENMNNPELTRETFNKLKFNNTNHQPIIIRADGDYIYDRIYTIDDLIQIFNTEGADGLKGFGFLTLSTITEDGDIFGNPDTIFMQQNPSSKKIYVYKYSSIEHLIFSNIEALVEHEAIISDDVEKIDSSNRIDLLISTMIIMGNIMIIIGLMFIYKALSELEEEILIENKER